MPDSPFHPRYWLTWFGLGLLRCIVALPYTFQQTLGRMIGRLLTKTLKRRRHIAEVNIAICFPELSAIEQKNLVNNSIISTTIGALETGFSWWASDEKIRSLCKTEGFELLKKAKEQGRGVLLIGAHYTTLDLAGRIIGLHEELDITYRDQPNKAFDYCINQSRLRSFKNIIEKNEMRKMVKNLKNQHVVWYAPDQDFGRQGAVFAPFFGCPAATITTVGKLLKITNAKPLFYSFFRTQENGRIFYRARIHDPFTDDSGVEGFGDDDMVNATLLNKAITDAIREHPEQYLWVHERFRTQINRGDPVPYTRNRKKKKRRKMHAKNQ